MKTTKQKYDYLCGLTNIVKQYKKEDIWVSLNELDNLLDDHSAMIEVIARLKEENADLQIKATKLDSIETFLRNEAEYAREAEAKQNDGEIVIPVREAINILMDIHEDLRQLGGTQEILDMNWLNGESYNTVIVHNRITGKHYRMYYHETAKDYFGSHDRTTVTLMEVVRMAKETDDWRVVKGG